jgi:hypothetical protein
MDIQIVTFNALTGLAELGLPRVPRRLRGMDMLMQIVVLAFLRNPGKDTFSPNEGSGLRAAIGQYNMTNTSEVSALCLQRAKVVETEVIGRQRPDRGTPQERLRKLNVLDVAVNEADGAVVMRVQVLNEAGDEREVLL